MKNIQRGFRVLALLALFISGTVLLAQETTPEATEAPEATEEVVVTPEATDVVETEATEEVVEVEATEETVDTEVTPEATEEVVTAEVTEEAVAPGIEEVAGTEVTIVGSGIANPAVQALIDGSESTLNYTVTTTGTAAGFEAFCADTADATTSVRPINVQEDTACRDAGVEYIELLIGYDAMAFISNPEDEFLTCISTNNINNLFAPSAANGIVSWSEVLLPVDATQPTETVEAEVTPEATEEPFVYPDVTILVPQDNTITYATLDGVTAGFGLRQDAVSLDAQAIVDTVASTSGALGVVPLGIAQASDSVSILNVDFAGDAVGCETPSAETVESGTYLASTPLYLYVRQSSQETLAFFLNYITDASSATALSNAGYVAPSETSIALNRDIVNGEASARAITAEEVTYNIPPNLTGTINVVGSTSGFRLADTASQRLSATQQQLVINNSFNGQVAGINNFCNGDADILFVNGDPFNVCETAVEATEEADSVASTPVTYEAFELGQQAVVLVANADDSYANCLDRTQINSIWSSTATDTVVNWSDVGESFPETPLILVGVNPGNVLTDILLTPAEGGAPAPVRVDVAETNNNATYRAAAAGNVSGALVYMSWVDYQNVLEAEQENIQLVAVDSGSGCIVPSEETIADGSYSLARTTTMLVKTESLATVPVQSLVWTMFSDNTYPVLETLGFVLSTPVEDLPDFRNDLLALFETAEASVMEVTAEVTPEVTPEATAEVTEEASE